MFLHTQTHAKYALARTERNIAPGYHGFTVHASPGVTLKEDLVRRDLTISSIAVHVDFTRATAEFDAEPLALAAHWHSSGALVGPYVGCQDIADKVLRHVTLAFRDAPVPILRLARFAARFAGVHPLA